MPKFYLLGKLALLLGAIVSHTALSASADSLMRQLKGAVIIESGTVTMLSCPISGKYDCLSWPNGLHKYQGSEEICFQLFGEYFTYDDAMLMAKKNGELFIAVKSGFGSKYEIFELDKQYACPDAY